MASSRRERVGILVAAILFFVASFGSTALVLWQLGQEDDTSSQTSLEESTNETPQEGKLEGTKLADFTPLDNVDKLQTIDLKEGTGTEVTSLETPLTFHYTGALASDGTIFQSSHDIGQPITYPLSQLIKGWQEGIPGMKEGGKRRLLIPSEQAYGAQAQPGIPANSDLVFDIELVKAGE